MYSFAVLSLPLSFLALVAWYPRPRAISLRLFARGALVGIPGMALWILARPLFRPSWGGALLALSFFLKYWLFPFAAAIGGFALAVGFNGRAPRAKVPLGRKVAPPVEAQASDTSPLSLYERALPFVFGLLSVLALAQAINAWGDPDAVTVIVLPLSTLVAALALPALLADASRDRPVLYALAGLGACVTASFGAASFYLRLEWLGVALTILFIGGVGTYGIWRFMGEGRRVVSSQ